MTKPSSNFIKTTALCTAMVCILIADNISAAPPARQSESDVKTQVIEDQIKGDAHTKARLYPNGYQFYRHGRGHRHGPTRGYYNSKILSSQGGGG